jgi:GNAT superfamily N-acetyltransferase
VIRPTPSIRRARAEDLPALLELWLGLVDYHRRLTPEFPAMAGIREVIASEIRRGVQRDFCRLYVADEGARLVGFLFAEVESTSSPSEPPPAWIHELWVEPEARGAGIGARLLREAETFFAERGVARLSVRVESANEVGRSFWARHGFAERARILERKV